MRFKNFVNEERLPKGEITASKIEQQVPMSWNTFIHKADPGEEIKDEQFEPAPDSPTRRRGTTVLTYDEVVAMRDKLQALDDSKEALSNVRYPIGMVLQELRALAFRMEHEKLVEVRA